MRMARLFAAMMVAGALVACGSQGADLASQRQAGTALATPDHVFDGAVYCDEAAAALGLPTGMYQTIIDTYDNGPLFPAGPIDITNGQTISLAWNGTAFSWTATTPISLILVYGRETEKTNAFVYDPAVASDARLLSGTPATNIYFIKVCWLPPQETGCTLTPGYWKTHSVKGPAPYDDTWAQLGENTAFFLSGKSYYDVLWTPPAGNGYYQLSFQYIAAVLNKLAGTSVPADVATALADAKTFFETYTPAQVAASKALKAAAVGMAGTLGDYNSGMIGPGHCDELEPN